ncbi:flavin-containing monooxygenase 5-like [Eublepharis macularius]|uniref:Flavin-containing monooxygenase n=1 Tax=Eublepharis macularius TaxID=481883 RepID=A0AA97L0K5_EUBMA|nr:flavin-containing monooxygenase 5-like [Eublepharis macularius]XP_054837890.1 flavin-containing monooxygenase 5-like [Eublepharis macularius]
MAKKRVAIIGGGSSGLCSIKCCLDEDLEPVCFESSDDIGGLWRFKENPEEDRASIYKSVIINTSKEMMCFSDFPIPEDYPNYMPNNKIMDYFRIYAKHFDLLKYIRLRTKVCSVTRRPDFASTGQWDVVVETDGKQESSVFDAILICTGHHTTAHLPLNTFPGIEKFKGHYFHSRDYKNPNEFTGKRGIVVGIGNSGGDLAVEISHTAEQVFLSTRRGSWILNRVNDKGYPGDVVLTTRLNALLKRCLSPNMVNNWVENQLNERFNHSHYGLKPKHRFFSQHPTVNDELPNRIISGKVQVKPNIKEITESAVVFEDGSKEENIDFIVFATGYSFAFPFLGNTIRVVENQTPLYKFVFPPHLEKPTLAIIGLVQPLGAIMPISELQARWATRVFKGLNTVPSTSEMMSDITSKKAAMAKRYVKSPRHTIQVDYIDYMDEVATEIGVKPNVWSLFRANPRLAWQILRGPCTPYQYRLQGPGKWTGAEKAILTQHDRIIKPLRTRATDNSPSGALMPFMFKMAALAVVVLAILYTYF